MTRLIDSILIGPAVPLRGLEHSAIAKAPVYGTVNVTFCGLTGDQQADLTVHGGPEKAIHHYPRDHYAMWLEKMPDHPLLAQAGAFGENISTLGMTEETVCIGDRYRIGTAIVEVSQPRQPCWKQGHRMGWTTLPRLMVRERKAGWYYRVIEQGAVAAGDRLELLERVHPEWTVARVFALVIGGEGKADTGACRTLAELNRLNPGWQRMAAAIS